jgi:hypothetical protein
MVRRRVGRSVPIAFPVRCPVAVPIRPFRSGVSDDHTPLRASPLARVGGRARGRAAAVRHRPRVGPRPRDLRRRPAPVRAAAPLRRHLRHADAVAAAARRADAPLVDSVDRAMRDLKTAGLVRVERRRRGRESLTDRYHLRTTNPTEKPRPTAAAQRQAETDETPDETEGGGRRSAAQPKARDRESSSPPPLHPDHHDGAPRVRRRRRSRRPIPPRPAQRSSMTATPFSRVGRWGGLLKSPGHACYRPLSVRFVPSGMARLRR